MTLALDKGERFVYAKRTPFTVKTVWLDDDPNEQFYILEDGNGMDHKKTQTEIDIHFTAGRITFA